ncbi:MAG: hypothetical protein Q7S52_04480 [bacterium]|nr:hypothetical protein [bacterium]
MKTSHVADSKSGMTDGQKKELLLQVVDGKFTHDEAQRIISGEFRKAMQARPKAVAQSQSDNANLPATKEMAMLIMGRSIVPPEKVFSERKILHEEYWGMLPPQRTLEYLKARDFLILPSPPIPLSLCDMYTEGYATKYDLLKIAEDARVHLSEKFARDDKTKPGWLIMRREALKIAHPQRTDKSDGIAPDERLPLVIEMLWYSHVVNMFLKFSKNSGIHSPLYDYVRCYGTATHDMYYAYRNQVIIKCNAANDAGVCASTSEFLHIVNRGDGHKLESGNNRLPLFTYPVYAGVMNYYDAH